MHCGILVVRSWVSGLGVLHWVLGIGYWCLDEHGSGMVPWFLDWWKSGHTHFFLYGPLWTLILRTEESWVLGALILRTEESWVLGVMDIGSGLSGLLGLVWTEIGCLDGQKLGPGLGFRDNLSRRFLPAYGCLYGLHSPAQNIARAMSEVSQTKRDLEVWESAVVQC